MHKIKDFWINSYKSDKVAFAFELVSFIFTVGASMTLALTARDPNMLIVYPAFFVGSVTQCYASMRRGAAWVMLLTGWFVCVNIFGYGVVVEGRFTYALSPNKQSHLAAILDKQISHNSTVLEVGCGTGQLSLFLKRFNNMIGIECEE